MLAEVCMNFYIRQIGSGDLTPHVTKINNTVLDVGKCREESRCVLTTPHQSNNCGANVH